MKMTLEQKEFWVKKITSEVVIIYPKMAEKMLEANIGNRPISSSRRLLYIKEMKKLNWLPNGDSIRFDIEGRMLDGQHKLSAIVASKEPQIFVVVKGLPPESFITIDGGKTRNAGENLACQVKPGENPIKYPALKAAGMKIFDKLCNKTLTTNATQAFPASLIAKIYKESKELIELIDYTKPYSIRKAPVHGSYLFLLSKHSNKKEKIKFFFNELSDLSHGKNQQTINSLATYLMYLPYETKSKLTDRDICGMLLTAFKAFDSGTVVEKVTKHKFTTLTHLT